ncbi:hypothetical protein H7J93_01530 [Mycobacterium barrassiae]|uniref:hypothetical protein n=1 Tax=Mycobacterium barrassiae TaxID=319709 RepID=UPI002265A9F1|nr:hypothetical protein [Mycobacterium barrassiae]MCV7298316.1 hypothetical protein [Mycobacterium barrassiae]
MADQTPAVIADHPPEKLLKVANPMLRFLLGTPLAGPLRNQLMVLKFKGRKSGRPFSIPVSAHHIDGTLYAIANAGWKHNFTGGADAEVVHGGKTTKMHGELISDPAVVADLAHRCAQSYGVKKAQTMMGLKFRDNQIPTLDEFKEGLAREKIVAVKFTPI